VLTREPGSSLWGGPGGHRKGEKVPCSGARRFVPASLTTLAVPGCGRAHLRLSERSPSALLLRSPTVASWRVKDEIDAVGAHGPWWINDMV